MRDAGLDFPFGVGVKKIFDIYVSDLGYFIVHFLNPNSRGMPIF